MEDMEQLNVNGEEDLNGDPLKVAEDQNEDMEVDQDADAVADNLHPPVHPEEAAGNLRPLVHAEEVGGNLPPPVHALDVAGNLPPPVHANVDEDPLDPAGEGGIEPKNKVAKREQNFSLKCVGEDISDDPAVPTIYRFHIQMNKDKENRIYEVEIEQGDFNSAHFNWSKQIKAGFLYCPGPNNAFIEQIKGAIVDYEEQEEDEVGTGPSKPKLRIKQESVVDIDGKVYFISGKNNVYIFTPENAPYVKKLTDEEISDLPVKIVYDAKEKSYDFDPKEILEKFFKLTKDFNSCQRPQHQTCFPYACLLNMKAELYMVVDDHRIAIFFCRITNAGKSMALLLNDKMYNGKQSSGILSGCSEPGLRKSLKRGRVGRFDEIDKKDSGSVTKLMKAIWPPGGGRIEMGYGTDHVKTTAIISTNLYPEELMRIWRMPHADLTKYEFNFFGETCMEHVREDFQEILNSCLLQAEELNIGKPLLLALGYKVYEKRCTGDQISKWDHIVGNKNQRFAQGLVYLQAFCDLLVSFADFLEIDEEKIPDSVSNPTFNCILKGKDIVARQAERKASDLISDVCQDPEEARKCLVIAKKGRRGVGICTAKLKESSTWRSWMQPILNKLPEFDTDGPGGRRIRGRLVLIEELDDLFPFVNELLTVTAEKILSLIANETNKKKKKSLKELKDNVVKFCVPIPEEENAEDDWEDAPWMDDHDMMATGEEEIAEGEQDDDDDELSDAEDVIQFEGGIYVCTVCKGKKFKWKTERGADNHVEKFH